MRKNRGDFDNVVKDNILIGSSRSRKLNCLKRGSVVYLGDYRTVKYMSLFMNTNSLKKISNIFNKFYFDGNIFKILDISDIKYSSCFSYKNASMYNLNNKGRKIWFVNNLIDKNYDDEIIDEEEKLDKLKESFNPKEFLGNLEFKINSGSLSRIFFYNQAANYNAMIYSKSVSGIIAAPFCFINLFEKIYDLIETSKLSDFIRFDRIKSLFEIMSNYITLSILLSNYNLAKKIKYTNLYGSNPDIIFGSEINEEIEDYIPVLNSIFIYKNYQYNSENHTDNGNKDILKYVFPITKFYISRLLKSLKILKYLNGEGLGLDGLLKLEEEFLLDKYKIKIDEYSKASNLFSRYFYGCEEFLYNEKLIRGIFSKDYSKSVISKLKLKESIIIYNFLSTLYNFEPNLFCNNPKELFYSLDINRENTINAGRKCIYLNFDSSRLNDYTNKVINDISKDNSSTFVKRNKIISNYNYFKPFVTIVNSNKILRYNSESMASELELSSYNGYKCFNKKSQLNLMSRYYDSVAKHNVALRDNSDDSIAAYNTEDHIKLMYLDRLWTFLESSIVDYIEPFNTNFVFSIDKEAIIRSLIEDKIFKKIDHKCSIFDIKSLFDLFNDRHKKLSDKIKINSYSIISKFVECNSCFTKYINKILMDSDSIIELLVGSILLPSYLKILNKNFDEKNRTHKNNTNEIVNEFLKLEDEFKNKKDELIISRFNKNFKVDNSSPSYLDDIYEKIMYPFKFVRFLNKLISKLKTLTEDELLYFNENELKMLENVFNIVFNEYEYNLYKHKILLTDMITVITKDFDYEKFKSIELYRLFRARSIFKVFLDKRRTYNYERICSNKRNSDDFVKNLLCFEKGGNVWSALDYLKLPNLYLDSNRLPGVVGTCDVLMYQISLSLKIRISLLIQLYIILMKRKHKKIGEYASETLNKLLNDYAKKQNDIYNIMFCPNTKSVFVDSINEKIFRLIEDDLKPFMGINEKDCNYKTVTCQNIKMSLLDNKHNLNIQYRNLYKKFRKILNSYKFSIKINNSEQTEEVCID